MAITQLLTLGVLVCLAQQPGEPAVVSWRHLSSATGDLPVPGTSLQQTAAIVVDLDGDRKNDFVLGFRQVAPALVGYYRGDEGWERRVIEPDFLTIEAGGACYDIDADGDTDLVFGADAQGRSLWWWENPGNGNGEAGRWPRHVIKDSGEKQHHDQLFVDALGTGRSQLVFWNQRPRTLFLAEIPKEPKRATMWELVGIHKALPTEKGPPYVEGLSWADMDGDGAADLLAGNGWLRRRSGVEFEYITVAEQGGRIVAGRFTPSRTPQVVIAPGDGVGPLWFVECGGKPEDAAAWQARELLDRPVVHGHSLELGDMNGDGHLDIFCGEMAEWTGSREEIDNPEATAWILHGDGQGGFRRTVLARGIGFHEARVADLDGDGDLDILNKPYTWQTPRVDVWINNGVEGEEKP